MADSTDISPREYHARREAERRAEREGLRLRRIAQVEAAVRRMAPQFPAIRAVYLFGSITRPGQFAERSDIDVAIDCDDLVQESEFWPALEQAVGWNIDLRPYDQPAIAQAVADSGHWKVYERESPDFAA
jgi:predicted nucleotidyltransferase